MSWIAGLLDDADETIAVCAVARMLSGYFRLFYYARQMDHQAVFCCLCGSAFNLGPPYEMALEKNDVAVRHMRGHLMQLGQARVEAYLAAHSLTRSADATNMMFFGYRYSNTERCRRFWKSLERRHPAEVFREA